ncbi:MAG: TonB family protein [Deltaproteobacteria bacterium]|nr:TonB family protein [Deltaproteobacteria bacterium]
MRALTLSTVLAALMIFSVDVYGTKSDELKKMIVPPKVVKTVAAVFPASGYTPRGGVEVVLKFTVLKDGKVGEIFIQKSGGTEFDKAAVDALEKWVFKPAEFEGKKIAVKISVPFKFPERLKKSSSTDVKTPLEDGNKPDVKTPSGDGNKPDVKTPSGDGNKPDVKTPSGDGNKPDVKTPSGDGNNSNKTPTGSKHDSHAGHDHGTYHDRPTKDEKVIVKGVLEKKVTASIGEFKIAGKVLSITTKKSGGDMLAIAPGLYIGHPQGEGIANTIFLRGFNAEHGQDFEIRAGFVPVNLPGHIHAQGYADMHFIIPELIDSITVIEGVYDVTQGDFAVAGSAIFNYGVKKRGMQSFLTYGSYNTRKLKIIFAPEGQAKDTFAAGSLSESDGYGDGNRASTSGSVVGRYHFCTDQKTHLTLHVGGYAGRSILPGVLRLDDVKNGAVDFYGTYDYPTARAQSGYFNRFEASFGLLRYLEGNGEKIHFSTYVLRTDFRLRQNYTGFMLWYADQPDLKGAGDLHQQTNTATSIGGDFLYESGKYKILTMPGMFRFGVSVRSDFIDQKEDLIFPAQNMIWRHVTDAVIQMSDLGVFTDAKIAIFSFMKLRAGFRADILAFQINDELANRQYNVPVEQNYLLGYKRDAMGLAYGPRGALEFGPFFTGGKKGTGLTVVSSYGEGFRSPPPRSLQEGERAPFAKVQSFETGVKYRLKGLLETRLTGFYTYLSDDYIYNPATAMTISIGNTMRYGSMGTVTLKPLKGLLFNGSLTYSRGVLKSSPLATSENPNPGEKAGDLIPYIPPWVGRLDGTYSRKIVVIKGGIVQGTVGMGYTFLGKRPLPYSQWADRVHLVDIKVELAWKNISFRLDISNIVNSKWNDMELNFISQWNPDVPTSLPQRHIVAGAPRMIMGTLGIAF